MRFNTIRDFPYSTVVGFCDGPLCSGVCGGRLSVAPERPGEAKERLSAMVRGMDQAGSHAGQLVSEIVHWYRQFNQASTGE
jgi:hypothetical protein